MVTLQDFFHRLKSSNHLVQHNKQHHRKELLSRFHVNVIALGFHPLLDSSVAFEVKALNKFQLCDLLLGPAAIAQTLDGTHLPDSPVVHMHQVNSQNRDVVVSPDPLGDVHVTVISSMETSLAATLSPSSGLTISQHALTGNNSSNDLSVNAVVPQVTLPDQILQSQSDEPSVLSPTETTSVMMVSENPISVTSTLEHPENWLTS